MVQTSIISSIGVKCLQSIRCPIYVRALSTETFQFSNPSEINDVRKKCLKVAIVGAPNAGKSTFLNQIIRRRVFPVSKKVHTTRYRARAVSVEGDTQLVFLDTPGLVSSSESAKYGLEKEFLTGGEEAIGEADVIGVVHDLSNGFTKAHLDPKVLRLLHLYRPKKSFLVMNKIDTIKSKKYLLNLADLLTGGHVNEPLPPGSQVSEKLVTEVIKRKSYWEHFNEVFMVSALLGQGTESIRNYLLNSALPGEWEFPEEQLTDQGPVRLIEDTVRASLLENLPQEIPYNLNVQIEFLDMDLADQITAVVLVGCRSPRIARLVVGNKGERIKAISSHAETILTDTFQKDFTLRVVVNVSLRPSVANNENVPAWKTS